MGENAMLKYHKGVREEDITFKENRKKNCWVVQLFFKKSLSSLRLSTEAKSLILVNFLKIYCLVYKGVVWIMQASISDNSWEFKNYLVYKEFLRFFELGTQKAVEEVK
jgi:hypothetical protein